MYSNIGLKIVVLFCCLAFAASRTIISTKTALSLTEKVDDEIDTEPAEASPATESVVKDLDDALKFNREEKEEQQVENPPCGNIVAFYAYLDHSVSFAKYNVLQFNTVVYNAGNGYNPHTGVFTVPEPGTYILSFHFEDWRGVIDQRANLYVDGNIVAGSIIHPRHSSTQAGTTVILYLKKGQAVYVKVQRGLVYGYHTERYTVFTGALLAMSDNNASVSVK